MDEDIKGHLFSSTV